MLVFLKSSVPDIFIVYFPFMFLTAAHLSTPFWCFAAPESSSHPPAHNPLCAHQTEMASGRQRETDRWGDCDVMWLNLKNSLKLIKLILFYLYKQATIILHLLSLIYGCSSANCTNLELEDCILDHIWSISHCMWYFEQHYILQCHNSSIQLRSAEGKFLRWRLLDNNLWV